MVALRNAVRLGVKRNHDIVFEKDGKYVTGRWSDQDYAQAEGWVAIDTIAALCRKFGLSREQN